MKTHNHLARRRRGIASLAMRNLRPEAGVASHLAGCPSAMRSAGNISSHRNVIARAAWFHIGHSRASVLAASPASLLRTDTWGLMGKCRSLGPRCLSAVPAACACARPPVHAACNKSAGGCITGISVLPCQLWASSTSICSSTGMRQRPARIPGELERRAAVHRRAAEREARGEHSKVRQPCDGCCGLWLDRSGQCCCGAARAGWER